MNNIFLKYFWFTTLTLISLNNYGQRLRADFTISEASVCSGSSVEITDNSQGTTFLTSYHWDFGENASPRTSRALGPHVVFYNGEGENTITLTITNFFDSDSKSREIKISSIPPSPEANITPSSCNESNGIIEITSPVGDDIQYSIDGENWNSSNVFTGLTAGGTYSVFVRNPVENPNCISSSEFTIESRTPDAPGIGTIIQPDCDTPTGNVSINNLPSSGTWKLIRYPGAVSTEGTGTSTTIAGLNPGSYTFRVTNADGCSSPLSNAVVINEQPPTPPVPVHTVYCSSETEFALIRINEPLGNTYRYSLDGETFQESPVFDDVPDGTYKITVRNEVGCIAVGDEFEVRCSCTNPPEISSPQVSGTTCSANPITVTGNTFSGSATRVFLTENGAGRVTSEIAETSPFSFTYIPSVEDEGKVITITLTTDNPSGKPCEPASITYSLSVSNTPGKPVAETVTHPDCDNSRGAVHLVGLPPNEEWILRTSPGDVVTRGSGPGTTIEGLSPGTYTFTVINSAGCISPTSEEIIVNPQPPTPDIPSVINITHPDCDIPTGEVTFNELPPSGNWKITGYPGVFEIEGNGANATISDISPGTYNFVVTNSFGCISGPTENITINKQPETPSAPVVYDVVQPSCTDPYGSVDLTDLPDGNWVITRLPDSVTVTGEGRNTVITGLQSGSYTFKVSGESGCTSAVSEEVTIVENPSSPNLIIYDPATLCFPETADLTDPAITGNSSENLVYSYWLDEEASEPMNTPESAGSGTYFIKATNNSGCFDFEAVTVTVKQPPFADAGPDQNPDGTFETTMNANEPAPDETAAWSIAKGKGIFNDLSDPDTKVYELSVGENIFIWTITNEVCPPAHDSVIINVKGSKVPTLITPNFDGHNDYLIFPGNGDNGKIQLIVFNRYGVEVFRDNDYRNDWNGTDKDGNPLPEDTYFYVISGKSGEIGKSFIVIRR